MSEKTKPTFEKAFRQFDAISIVGNSAEITPLGDGNVGISAERDRLYFEI